MEDGSEERVIRDTHGFVVPHNLVSKYRALQARSAWWAPSTDWAELLEQARRKEYRAGGPLPPKFVAAVNEGIPAKHRPAAWMLLTGAEARKAAQPQLYERLVAASAPRSVEEAVELDVRRTFPEHNRLTPEFVERMRRVLLAYAKRNPEVGYCQGMNFVAASILLFLEAEEDAFWLLSYVVEEVLPDHYVQSMIGHTVDRQVAEQLVELHLPALSNHLRELSLSMPFVTTHWFLCLFVTALPSESAFRLWDLILCHDAAWIFRGSLALFAMMEAQELLEATDLGTAVFVIKSSTRAAFDASEIIGLANARFHGVGAPLIHRLRREWRRTTMESMHAKLRVKELYEAQQQVATFAVEQAKSLLLSLKLEGKPTAHALSESEVVEALGRVLPDEETKIVLAFLQSTAAAKNDVLPLSPEQSSPVAEDAFKTPQTLSTAAVPGGGGMGEVALMTRSFIASQVAVGMAVLCDGPVDERLRICFEAFDALGEGYLGSEAIVSLLHAIYRTYYRQPPTEEEVRTAAEVMFLNVASSPPRQVSSPRAAGASGKNRGVVSVDAFVVLASSQPTLVQCFAMRGKRPLLTPRGVDQRKKVPQQPSSTLDQLVPLLIPTCGARDKPLRSIRPQINPTASRGPLRDDKRLAAAAADPTQATGGLLGLGTAVFDGIHAVGATMLSGTTDVFGGMGGALDGALTAMQVPLKRNPMGLTLKDADELAMALSEADLEPPKLRLVLGFDCTAHNRRAGQVVFSGRPLHASNNGGVLGPDPNPYQLAIFMLGKALECIGVGVDTPVRCFCYNTMPPPPDARAEGSAMSEAVDDSAANAEQWAEPVVTVGMEGALAYYNGLPPYIFRGARGSGAAGGLAQAVEYGAALATADVADGGIRTLLLLLTPGQGIDTVAARTSLHAAAEVPLSVVAVGVGDGPFHELGRLAAAAPTNLNAVDFHQATSTKFPDRELALEAFRVLPEQAELTAILKAARLSGPASHDVGHAQYL